MHRSRSSLLVILAAAAAACSTSDASQDTAILAQDTTLVARLDVAQQAELQPLPDACAAVATATQPTAAHRAEAEKLARQAYDAELLGKVQDAKALLLRAGALDGTDRTAAYHLARTSESMGDGATATRAYCRFLSLAPTSAESAEARQRLATLSPPPETRTVASRVGRGAPVVTARHALHRQPTPRRVRTRVASAEDMATTTIASAPTSVPTTTTAEADGSVDLPAGTLPVPPAPRTASRGPSRAQGAGIGAMAGAMIGAATGRSVKSAVIGAAAGGLLGTLVVGQRQ